MLILVVMKYIFILLLCIWGGGMAFPQKHTESGKSEVDSLSFSYDVRDMTILVNDTAVSYSVVFDPETGMRKSEYVMIRGTFSHFESIKFFGEKFRKGILIYQKKGECKDGK